jgi:hypothetical protein
MKFLCCLACLLFISPAFSQEINRHGLPLFPKPGWDQYELKGQLKSLEVKAYRNLNGAIDEKVPEDSLRDHYIVSFDNLGLQVAENFHKPEDRGDI